MAQEREQSECNVTGDANGADRHMSDDRIPAVVYNAAIPSLVDGAGFSTSGVVNAESQCGDNHTCESEEED